MSVLPRARRRSRRSFALVVLLVVVAAGCDWPMFAYGPAHTGFNPFETEIDVGNVASLQEAWAATLGVNPGGTVAPVVARGVIYAAANFPATVQAFDAQGEHGCSGSSAPKRCTALWTATIFGNASSLGVSDGVLFVLATDILYAFDAAGVQGCSGTPTTCVALWTAQGVSGSVVAANGLVYANMGSDVVAFDAAGVQGCSGAPKTCVPLWHAAGGNPAVANGILYTVANDGFNGGWEVQAFDAAGVRRCSGTPKTCTPLWKGHDPDSPRILLGVAGPTIAAGLVFVGDATGDDFRNGGKLVGFDAAGERGCTETVGGTNLCTAIWRAPTGGMIAPPAVAGNVVYVAGFRANFLVPEFNWRLLSAFDIQACMTTGQPPCAPLWSAPTERFTAPAVANGVVYARNRNASGVEVFAAYDAAGLVNCTGTPKTCAPITTRPVTIDASTPVTVDGYVYISSGDDMLRAYHLP